MHPRRTSIISQSTFKQSTLTSSGLLNSLPFSWLKNTVLLTKPWLHWRNQSDTRLKTQKVTWMPFCESEVKGGVVRNHLTFQADLRVQKLINTLQSQSTYLSGKQVSLHPHRRLISVGYRDFQWRLSVFRRGDISKDPCKIFLSTSELSGVGFGGFSCKCYQQA